MALTTLRLCEARSSTTPAAAGAPMKQPLPDTIAATATTLRSIWRPCLPSEHRQSRRRRRLLLSSALSSSLLSWADGNLVPRITNLTIRN